MFYSLGNLNNNVVATQPPPPTTTTTTTTPTTTTTTTTTTPTTTTTTTTTADPGGTWGGWNGYGKCMMWGNKMGMSKKRTRKCTDTVKLCIGPKKSYKYDCTIAGLFCHFCSVILNFDIYKKYVYKNT